MGSLSRSGSRICTTDLCCRILVLSFPRFLWLRAALAELSGNYPFANYFVPSSQKFYIHNICFTFPQYVTHLFYIVYSQVHNFQICSMFSLADVANCEKTSQACEGTHKVALCVCIWV